MFLIARVALRCLAMPLANAKFSHPASHLVFVPTQQKLSSGLAMTGETPMERTEFALYKNQMLEEAGDYEGALKNLDEIRERINGHVEWKEIRGIL